MVFFDTIKSFCRDKEYRNLLLTTAIILMLGAVVYHYIEGWKWLDAFYFSFITLTTIGFGDFAPQTDAGKIFTIIYTITGVGIILTFINTVYQYYNKQKKKKHN